MNEATDKVLSEIAAKIQAHQEEIVKLKTTANMVADVAGYLEPIYTDIEEKVNSVGPSRADAYYGKPLATAVREYLEFRGQAVPGDDVLRGLEQGGFDFNALNWAESGRLRSLAMSMSKNNTVFHKLPNGMWGLSTWYPDAVERKKARARAQEKGSAAGTTEPEETE
jgi:hypothetical protein